MPPSTEVIVLGGGIIGCSLAEELARHGRRVRLIDRGKLGAEASSAAAGILSAQMDIPLPGPFFDLCQAARRMYPRWIEHLERRAGMSVGYHVDGVLYLALAGRDERIMDRRIRWQRKLGLRVERWSPRETRRHEPALDGRFKRGYHFPTEAQVDNGAVMRALAEACRRAGVQVQEQTGVRRLVVRQGRVQGVETDQGEAESPVVINCLGSWAGAEGVFPTAVPVEPVRGQMLVFQGPRRLFRRAVMSDRAYVVQRRDGRLLVGSTIERAGFDKVLTLQGLFGILTGLRQFTTSVDPCSLIDAWAGFRPVTPDGLPIMDAAEIEGLYTATGHYRHGILLAPAVAKFMAELILRGRSSFDLSPFSRKRFRV